MYIEIKQTECISYLYLINELCFINTFKFLKLIGADFTILSCGWADLINGLCLILAGETGDLRMARNLYGTSRLYSSFSAQSCGNKLGVEETGAAPPHVTRAQLK